MERFRSTPRFFLICLLNDRERGRRIGIFLNYRPLYG